GVGLDEARETQSHHDSHPYRVCLSLSDCPRADPDPPGNRIPPVVVRDTVVASGVYDPCHSRMCFCGMALSAGAEEPGRVSAATGTANSRGRDNEDGVNAREFLNDDGRC